jgi:hypothetical protein
MVNDLIVYIRSSDIDTENWVHQRVRKAGDNPFMVTPNSNVILATFILEMYAKCSSLNIARERLNKILKRNIFAWKCYRGPW